MSSRWDDRAEWLDADGLGGFASGTVSGIRTRRYHALLQIATKPPTGRIVLVNGFDAWVETASGIFPISSQSYAPDVIAPDGARRIVAFEPHPWPRWTYALEDRTRIEQEIFTRSGIPVVAVCWRLEGGDAPATLFIRPFVSGRDHHALHHENPAFAFAAETRGQRVRWRPYFGVPGIVAFSNGEYSSEPQWYRNFLYEEERARGLDWTEDLASPGVFRFDLSRGEAALIFHPEWLNPGAISQDGSAEAVLRTLREAEAQRRAKFPSRLHLAADSYLVRRGEGRTIIAGYPWFTDWGRDTFIAMRGLCLATGRLDEAREILLEWAGAVSEGMLPNRFPDHGEAPEFNSVDASLWYIIAVHDFLRAMEAAKRTVAPAELERLRETIEAILDGYAKGTRYRIVADDDGLLAAGEPGVQLTWMDAKVGDWVVTPRIGKPVEVEALWLNALWFASTFSRRWQDLFVRGRESFRARFWHAEKGYLYDVVDPGHHKGNADATFRPNQIFAVGGLPLALLAGERARRVVDAVEARLWTPVGLRSLAPGSPGYCGRYEGAVHERDAAYHQGTVWPWLIGPFVEAWLRVRSNTPEAKREARARYLEPLLRHLDAAGLGHISEIADADPPHNPRGCPFQAWSVGEALRLALVVLAEADGKVAA
jgi:predicted glycogen debranching enzyme